MSPARVRHFTSMSMDELQSLTYKDFLVSETNELIAETPMRDEDKRLAVAYFINGLTCQEVADKFSMSLETAKRKKKELRRMML